jgi:hypothetical protein
VGAYVSAQDATREQLADQAAGLAQSATAEFASWYSMDAITAWAEQLAGNVQAVLGVLAGMVDAYLATIIGELAGVHMRPVGAIDVTNLRGGDVTHAGAYGRVADTYRWQQSRLDSAAKAILTDPNPTPPTLQSPIDAALDRAAAVAGRDAQLTLQQQAQQTMRAGHAQGLITGWRRVVHPELSKTGTCGLCIAASDRVYSTGDLMPLHDHCHCLPVPITATSDPGLQLDEAAFRRLYGEAGGTTREALKKTRYQITDHGELGPVLAPAGAKQRTPRQVAADTAPKPRRAQPPGQQLAKVRTLHDGLARSLRRVDQLAAEDPAQWEDYRRTLAERVNDLEGQLVAA